MSHFSFCFIFRLGGHRCRSVNALMIQNEPIVIHRTDNIYFRSYIYIGVHIGRIVRADVYPTVLLPTNITQVGLPYVQMYNLLVSLFISHPEYTFNQLGNALRSRLCYLPEPAVPVADAAPEANVASVRMPTDPY